MKREAKVNLRQQKQLFIGILREHLLVRDYTSIELAAATGLNMDNLRKYLREMTLGGDRVYVDSWFRDENGKWNARYRFGNKPSAPRPPKTEATALRQLRRARQGKPLTPEKRRLKTEYERMRRIDAQFRNPDLTDEQEAALLAAKAAMIKPRMDPWAHLFHGGVAVITGAAA